MKTIIAIFLLIVISSHIYAFYKPTHLHAQIGMFLPYVILITLFFINYKDVFLSSQQTQQFQEMLKMSGMLDKNQDMKQLFGNP